MISLRATFCLLFLGNFSHKDWSFRICIVSFATEKVIKVICFICSIALWAEVYFEPPLNHSPACVSEPQTKFVAELSDTSTHWVGILACTFSFAPGITYKRKEPSIKSPMPIFWKYLILFNIAILKFFKNSIFVKFWKRFQVTTVSGVNALYLFWPLPLNVHCLKASVLISKPQKNCKSRIIYT